MSAILVGTEGGLHVIDDPAPAPDGAGRALAEALQKRSVGALARGHHGELWALVDGREVWRAGADGEPARVAASRDVRLRCLLAWNDGLVVGAAGAHLYRLHEGALRRVEAFESVEGRETWGTPWGGPPDVRSLAANDHGTLYVNVHVGGIARTDDGGETFHPTIPVEVDVHQVVVPPASSARVIAATGARGLAESADYGGTWEYFTEGMHARYCRAAAVAGGTALVSCSLGPGGKQSALYRRPLGAPRAVPLERCRDGLPEWFDDNIDTGCLDAAGATVAFGTARGEVFASDDAGRSFRLVKRGLARVRAVLLL